MEATDGDARADVVIGIACAESASTARTAVESLQAGLSGCLGPVSVRVVVAEPASNAPATGEMSASWTTSLPVAVVSYDVGSRDVLRTPYHGVPGRVQALRALLEAARSAGARACAILDARSPDLTGERVRWLVGPVLDDAMDFVRPYYPRHVVEGAITKSILYPVCRTLFGSPIRQPAARDFGCSARAVTHLLAQHVWEEDGHDAAIDIWMTTEAVCSGFRVCEAQLHGRAHEPENADVSTSLAQVAGSLFTEMEQRSALWQRQRTPWPLRQVGESSAPVGPEPTVEIQPLIESFRAGYADLKEVWGEILPPIAIIHLKALAAAPVERFRLDERLWARIVYDFAVSHRLQTLPRDHLLGSLTPLYLGWLSSFVLDAQQAPSDAVEALLERAQTGFEAERPYLISRWRWPERFRN